MKNGKNMVSTTKLLIAALCILLQVCKLEAGEPRYSLVTIPSATDAEKPALHFPASGQHTAILVHQYGGSKETWIEFATLLQNRGIASLAIGSNGRRDVLAAIDFVKKQSDSELTLIGASMGGGSVLQATNQTKSSVSKVVLLSPNNLASSNDTQLKKLFLVAKTDMLAYKTYETYQESVKPKILKEYDGFEHGQHLLDGKHAKDVTRAVIDFILSP